jgi:cellulose synthase operon protein C
MSIERSQLRGGACPPIVGLVAVYVVAAWTTIGAAAEKEPVLTQEITTTKLLDALDERQMPDISLWVLDRIAKDPEAYPALQKEAAFRRATALVATSRLETDGAKRAQILDAAEKQIEQFLAGDPAGEQAIDAFTQKGNLLVERGRAKIDQAKRAGEDAKARLAEAVGFFDAAIKSLEGQVKKDQPIEKVTNAEDAVLKELRAVDTELAELQGKPAAGEESGKGAKKAPRKPSDGRRIEELEDRQDRLRGQLLQTRLLVGGAYYEKSRALPVGSKDWKAALEKSALDYKELYDKYRSRGAGLFARYYEGRNYVALAQAEADAKEKTKRMEQALLTLSDVRGLDGEAGFVPGLRAKAVASTLECWLDMKAYAAKEFKDFDERLQKIVLAPVSAERLDADWLAMKYRSAALFERMADAQAADKNKARPLLQNAKKLALEVAKVNRDYSKEARALLEQLGKALPDDAAGVAASFETMMDAVRVSLAAMQQKQAEAKQATAAGKAAEAEAAAKAAAAERDKVIGGLRKALPMATADDVDAVNQARYMLTFMLYDGRRLHDAAALGTFLADRYPNAKGSRQAAKIAMASLQQLSKDGVPEWRAAAKRQCADVAGLIMRTWPEDAESADAALIAIATATEAKDPDRLLEILDQVPASSPRRAEVLLRAGSALWRDVLEKRGLEEGVRPAADVLGAWKRRAAGSIDDGLAAIPAGAPAAKTTVAGALARVQMAVDDGDRELAMRLLTQPDYGPWTLVTGKDPAYTAGPLAESTLTVALRYFIQADQLDKAQEAMDRLEAVAGSGDEASAKLTAMYLTMGRDLQAQLDALGSGGTSAPADAVARATAILGGFEKFLDGVAKRDQKVSSQIWVATTYLSLGSGAGTGSVVPKAKADGYLAKSAEAYKRLLDKGGDEIAKFEPAIRLKVANVYRELGRWDDAQEQIDWILSDAKRQNSLDTQIQAAELLQTAGEKSADKAKAEQYLKEAIVGRKSGSSVAWGWGGIANKLARQAFSGSDEKALDARGKFFAARLNVARCRLERAGIAAQDRDKLLTMAFNDVAITYKLYPELGGKAMEKQFDKLLKEIEKAQGSPAPKGLNGLREAQPATAAPAAAGT